MIVGKEKLKLESLSRRVSQSCLFSPENFETMNAAFKEYTEVIKKLYHREPNIFGNIYNYGLAEIKDHRNLAANGESEEMKGSYFLHYKEYLSQSIHSALEYLTEFVLH